MNSNRKTHLLTAGIACICLTAASARANTYGDFQYTNDGISVTITGYTGSGGEISIPSSINSLPVTTLDEEAFREHASLTGVTIPDSVTLMRGWVFFKCTGLTDITIPDSVTSMGHGVFSDCTGLTNIVIGSQVRAIGNYALRRCPVSALTIPDSVTSIGESAFSECTNLTSLIIPNQVSAIGDWAFDACSALTNLVIGSAVETIGDYAFYGCSGLGSIVLPNSVTSIGEWAFVSCTGLTNVLIGNGISSIGEYAFRSCENLENVTIFGNISSMGTGVFCWCYALENVVFLGNAPAAMGTIVFHYCNNATVGYLEGRTGWGPTLGGRPTVAYPPHPQAAAPIIQGNAFHIPVSWIPGFTVEVEASTNLTDWVSLGTITLTAGTNALTDTEWINHPNRFYRMRTP